MEVQTQQVVAPEPPHPSPISYTVRIGVTGHRELNDSAGVSEAIDRVLGKVKDTLETVNVDPHQPYALGRTGWARRAHSVVTKIRQVLGLLRILPSSCPTAHATALDWTVVSPLAAGADQMVARAAINKLGASLTAILPFQIDDYRDDFETVEDLIGFNSLLRMADEVVDLSLGSDSAAPLDIDKRNAAYLRAGERVVDTCEILIAVWDGAPPNKIGGTADVVTYALSRERVVIWINAKAPNNEPRLLLKTERDRNGDVIPVSLCFPGIAAGLSPNLVHLAEYNRVASEGNAGADEVFRAGWNRLMDCGAKSGLSGTPLEQVLQVILPHYARADRLSRRYMAIHVRAAGGMYLLAATAVSLAAVNAAVGGAHRSTHMSERLILGEVGALIIAVGWYRLGLCLVWHEKWLSYRHMAERLRALIFTSLVDSDPGVDRSDDHSLPFYPKRSGWVGMLTEKVKTLLPAPDPAPALVDTIKQFALRGWIEHQIRYHESNAVEKEERAKWDHIIVGVLLGFTLASAIGHLICHGSPLLAVLAIACPAWASAGHAIGSVLDYERISARSRQMAAALHQIMHEIEDARAPVELSIGIHRAEEVMSTENHEWSVSLSFHRPSLPV